MEEEVEKIYTLPNDERQSHFIAACMLARKGHYAEALRELADALAAGECSQPEALDLQARIYAQQGMLFYAESCWRKAASADPANPVYFQALNALCQLSNRTYLAWRIGIQSALAVLLLLLVISSVGLWTSIRLQQAHTQRQFESLRNRVEQEDFKSRQSIAESLRRIDRRSSVEMLTSSTTQTAKRINDLQRNLLVALTEQNDDLLARVTLAQDRSFATANALSEQFKESNGANAVALTEIRTSIGDILRILHSQHPNAPNNAVGSKRTLP